MKLFTLTLVWYSFLFIGFAQDNVIQNPVNKEKLLEHEDPNLVPNNSFEQVNKCPEATGKIQRAVNWRLATIGTPDLLHRCRGDQPMGAPKNQYGEQKPHSGNAYAGIYMIGTGYGSDYREYLHTALIQPLEANKKYVASMYVSLGEISRYAVSDFGFYFSEDPVRVETSETIDEVILSMKNPAENIIEEANRWVLISDTFVAHGKEKYLTIGNFSKLPATHKKLVNQFKPGENSYYYVDDIMVQKVHEETVLEVGKTISLDHVYFENDKSDLLPESLAELNELVHILNDHAAMKIEIHGHTNNLGNDEYNMGLSDRRAAAVVNYLVSQGIREDRLAHHGYGETKPIADNDTQEGQKINRRVEFVVTEM